MGALESITSRRSFVMKLIPLFRSYGLFLHLLQLLLVLPFLWNLSHNVVVAAAWVIEYRSSTVTSRSTSSFVSSTTTTTTTTSRSLVSTSQIAVLDGAEWISFQECWSPKNTNTNNIKSKKKKKFGYLNVVVGTIFHMNQNDDIKDNKQQQQQQQQQRVIGIQAQDNGVGGDSNNIIALSSQVGIYRDSMSTIPPNIKDANAISTYLAAMSVHCCLPKIDNVGGSDRSTDGDSSVSTSGSSSFVIPKSKVVVLGGSDFACFAAEALATLGAKVSLVSTRSPKIRQPNVQVLTPAVGELQLGFCSVVGQFDAMLDTLHDERKKTMAQYYNLNDDDNDDDENDGDDDSKDEDELAYAAITASVLPLLALRHSCTRYFSTLTQAQQMIREGGVLFGPRQADDHVKSVVQQLDAPNRAQLFQYIGPPPLGLGHTVQTLFERNVIFPNTAKKVGTSNKNPLYARGWSLSDFWEYTTWPRDTTGDVRYGLPVLTESEFGLMKTAAQAATVRSRQPSKRPIADESELDPQSEEESEESFTANPFVKEITNIEDLQRDIVSSQRDCVLFLSASYCRTCRTIQPAFTRLARTTLEETANDFDQLLFAKADTSGPTGKELGRALTVASVPTFLLFRKGRQYGSPLSIAKLPSKKLNLAISLLTRGMPWDSAAFAKLEEGGTTKK